MLHFNCVTAHKIKFDFYNKNKKEQNNNPPRNSNNNVNHTKYDNLSKRRQ
ncbi:protein of unknown function [Xenorhabdus doucetiae]|uniref:Uncharacterized protein n=1 Tax=Xenorhabdus doucetiae TaxID=351671 RepID=A0A068QVR4_9GAMM|nr:protein of unknown function [Xenorhabdus doucetiae]